MELGALALEARALGGGARKLPPRVPRAYDGLLGIYGEPDRRDH